MFTNISHPIWLKRFILVYKNNPQILVAIWWKGKISLYFVRCQCEMATAFWYVFLYARKGSYVLMRRKKCLILLKLFLYETYFVKMSVLPQDSVLSSKLTLFFISSCTDLIVISCFIVNGKLFCEAKIPGWPLLFKGHRTFRLYCC